MGAAVVDVGPEDVVRTAMAPDAAEAARQAAVEDAAACVRRHGAIAIRDAIPPAAQPATPLFIVRGRIRAAEGQP